MNDQPNRGAKSFRCAFQVNPAHYAETFRSNGYGLGGDEYVSRLLDKCVALGVDVIAVTHADTDGTWDDSSASTVVETDRLPKFLQQYAEPPVALQRYWEQHPLPGNYSGWSWVPVSEPVLERLRAELQGR